MTIAIQTPPDLSTVKRRQQAMWSAGDYAVIGTTLSIVGEQLCEAIDLRAGRQVLDVATGNGNAALAAARRWCEVTAIDYVPALLERGRERAAAERLPITFAEGDAENIPFPEASFDVVLSTFGVMFSPNQELAARELVRVCRPGGTIGMASWTPEGFVGQMFRIIGACVPPPPGLKSPARWGTEVGLHELFGSAIATLKVARRHFIFRYLSAQHWLDTLRTYYGPMLKAFAVLDASRQEALAHELTNLVRRFHQGGASGFAVPGEYLEVVLTTPDA
jgi:SAM-dependent methyltransferase